MLSKIRILQIGDVHLPTAARAGRNVDQKDNAFSLELRNTISAVPAKVVFKQIHKILEDGHANAIIFMGDFTDQGGLENYDRSVAFIANSLQLGAGRNNEAIPVGIVPGNHDINRDLAMQPGIATKFAPLNNALRKHGLPDLPVEDTLSQSVHVDRGTIEINLMNSCWGCGASEYIPAEFREGVGKAIQDTILSSGLPALKAYYDRQFDTPAFANESIEQIVDRAANSDPNALFIVAAHHNLLPQRLTRLAPYTELVNSGALRASLLNAARPIIYLHGHIHEDPIEIMTNPGGESLISISAPTAESGFNLLEISFTRAGMPLACHIYPWRFNPAGILFKGQRTTIPLIGKRRRSHNISLRQIYSYLLSSGECYWSEIVGHRPAFFSTEVEANTREALELLLADDSVCVENYEFDPENWIVRAKI